MINTHGHWDHCSGNQLFPDSIIIGQKNCPEYIRQFPANTITNLWSVMNLVSELKEQLDSLQVDSEPWDNLCSEIAARQQVPDDLENRCVPTAPAKTFQDSLTLNLGDLTVKMIYAGNAHTNHDIFIYVPEEKIVITGDLFSTQSYFGFRVNQMTDVDRMVSAIDQILNSGNGLEWVITSLTEILTGEDLKTIRTSLLEKFKIYKDKSLAAILLKTLLTEYQISLALEKYKILVFDSGQEYYHLEEEYTILGRRLMGEGRLEAALTVFRLQSESFPESALVYDNLGEVYLKMDKMDKAIQDYENSLRILPYNRNAEEILKII